MKNKGVMISILLIICLGVFVTTSTKRFVSDNQNSSDIYKNQTFASAKDDALPFTDEQNTAEENLATGSVGEKMARSRMAGANEEAFPQEPSAVPETFSADQDVPSDMPMAISDSQEGAMAAPATVDQQGGGFSSKESAVAISPLTGARSSVEDQTTVVLNAEAYRKKLHDIDSQIKKMKDSGIEPNTDAYKNMAEYEYRLWDNELNSVYQAILSVMLEEEANALRAEEREWIKERDTVAHKAISKYNGGTIESLEYTASLADSTRTRVYYLVESYAGYLDQTVLNIIE